LKSNACPSDRSADGRHRHKFKATNHAAEMFDGSGIAVRRVPLLLLPGSSAMFRIDAPFPSTGFVAKGPDSEGATAIEGVEACQEPN
jgi:hypothetical protein